MDAETAVAGMTAERDALSAQVQALIPQLEAAAAEREALAAKLDTAAAAREELAKHVSRLVIVFAPVGHHSITFALQTERLASMGYTLEASGHCLFCSCIKTTTVVLMLLSVHSWRLRCLSVTAWLIKMQPWLQPLVAGSAKMLGG